MSITVTTANPPPIPVTFADIGTGSACVQKLDGREIIKVGTNQAWDPETGQIIGVSSVQEVYAATVSGSLTFSLS